MQLNGSGGPFRKGDIESVFVQTILGTENDENSVLPESQSSTNFHLDQLEVQTNLLSFMTN